MTYRPIAPHIPVTLIAGDGIGNEIVDATLAALEALRAPFDWDRQVAGRAGMQADTDPLPQRTLDSIRGTRLVLKGPLASGRGAGHRSRNARLREEFQLYANSRAWSGVVWAKLPRRVRHGHGDGGRVCPGNGAGTLAV